MILLLNIVFFVNLLFLQGNCQNGHNLSRVNSQKNVNEVKDSNGITYDSGVKMRSVRGRSFLRRGHSRQPSEGTMNLIKEMDNPDYVKSQMISPNLQADSVLSIANFDRIINSRGKSIEDLTKEPAQNQNPFSRTQSVMRHQPNGRMPSFFRRRHSLSHATIRHKKPTMNQFIPTFNGFSIEPYLGSPKYCISNNVWRDVWRGCSYLCFAADQFIELKFRLIDELNRYRKIHKVQPLLKDITLYQKAQLHVIYLANTNSIRRDNNDIKNGLVMGVAYYPAASVLMKKWYDEGYRYDYRLNYPRPGSQSFTQLIWEKTTHVGIGVINRGYRIWVALKFFPRGNINGKYRKNIHRPKHSIKCPE
uniref:CAP domain-containing protein (inferred by orthology to a zebrafish protein) n=1 Tax=Strongyloides venezuelensis TaxID=75913 RepID=A0A0K0G047_STRVS